MQCTPEAGASQAVLCRAMMLRYPAAGSWQKTTCSWPIAYGSFSMVQRTGRGVAHDGEAITMTVIMSIGKLDVVARSA